jgi:hypothetical protein
MRPHVRLFTKRSEQPFAWLIEPRERQPFRRLRGLSPVEHAADPLDAAEDPLRYDANDPLDARGLPALLLAFIGLVSAPAKRIRQAVRRRDDVANKLALHDESAAISNGDDRGLHFGEGCAAVPDDSLILCFRFLRIANIFYPEFFGHSIACRVVDFVALGRGRVAATSQYTGTVFARGGVGVLVGRLGQWRQTLPSGSHSVGGGGLLPLPLGAMCQAYQLARCKGEPIRSPLMRFARRGLPRASAGSGPAQGRGRPLPQRFPIQPPGSGFSEKARNYWDICTIPAAPALSKEKGVFGAGEGPKNHPMLYVTTR